MHITRQHYVVVLHLGASSTAIDSLVEAALPLSDEFHFRAIETGFPDHAISYSVQSLSSLTQHQASGNGDNWRKPSEFRRGSRGNKATETFSTSKENLPPSSSGAFATESSVHSAIRLHQILDALPSALGGETLLTILWPSFDRDGEDGGAADPDDHVELFGALKRASDWFDARLFIGLEGQNVTASLWRALIGATPLSSSQFTRDVVFDARLIWIGSVGEGKERFRLTVADEMDSTKTRKRQTRKAAGVDGCVSITDAEADPPVRLLLSYSLRVKRRVPRHKTPLHRVCSEPEFYLIPHSSTLSFKDGPTSFFDHLFPPSSDTSESVVVSLDFVIDGKLAPSSKENGAGRRHWDKLAASTSGSTSGDENPILSALEFVFNRPHLTTSWKTVRDKRTVDFIAFPSNDAAAADGTPFLKLFRLRQEVEINSIVFLSDKSPNESNEDIDENFLLELDRLPTLATTDSFTRCVETFGGNDGDHFDAYLSRLNEDGTLKSVCVHPTPSASDPDSDPDHPASLIDILNAEDDLGRSSLVGDPSTLLKDGDNVEAGGVDVTAAGGLLHDVAALVQADIQGDPFNVKVRAEDLLEKYLPRLEELLAKRVEEKRNRQMSFEGATIASIPWPDVKEIQWHDVYYNRGLESEERAQEIHLLKTRCQPVETNVTTSRHAATKGGHAGSTKSSQSYVAVDHFDLFSVGTKAATGGENGTRKRKRTSATPSKRRPSSACFASPTKSSSVAKPKTPRKTPSKKDVFSPVAKKLLDRAKAVLTSPRKSLSTSHHQRSTSKKESAEMLLKHAKGGKPDATSGLGPVEERGKSKLPSNPGHPSATGSVSSACQRAEFDSTPKDKERESRSERNKKKLKEICTTSLKDRGVGRKDAIFNDCFTRLYSISKSFVKDLKTSQNLREEMRKIVESHADLVVSFEKSRV